MLFRSVINAIILEWIPYFVTGFHVHGFISAFFGSLLLSLITGLFTGYERRLTVRRTNQSAQPGKVIDI